MRIRLAMIVFVSSYLGSLAAQAQTPSAQSTKPGACVVDDGSTIFPICIFQSRDGALFIPKEYLKRYMQNLDFNEYGLAALSVESFGGVYINRRGRLVIRDVAFIDNGPDAFHHGLVRIERDHKYGFADPSGHIVVPMEYSCALNYADQYQDVGPVVCVECRIEQQGEYHACLGGKWFRTDRHGHLTSTPAPSKSSGSDGPG
ncbi:MAG TPA: hypothetical protein VKB38_11575 [Terracidiphilus sp.]|nr:hypothetical protein [Terracidiphilus sp.]